MAGVVFILKCSCLHLHRASFSLSSMKSYGDSVPLIQVKVSQFLFCGPGQNPIQKVFTFFLHLRYLNFRFLLHLRHKNLVHTPFWNLQFLFPCATLEVGCKTSMSMCCGIGITEYIVSYRGSVLSVPKSQYVWDQSKIA